MLENRDTLLIGDQAKWGLRVKVDPGTELLAEPLENPVVPGVELIENWRVDTLTQGRDGLELQIQSTLTSFDSGSFVVPGRDILLLRPDGYVDTLHLEQLSLEYTTIAVDTTGFVAKPLKEQMNYPVTFAEVLPWAGGGVLLLALVVALVWLIRRRMKNQPVLGHSRPSDPPHVVALRELDRIRAEKLWQQQRQKEYYTAVTDTIRKYIEGRYRVSAMESTTPEIIAMLKGMELPEKEFAQLQDLLFTADLVKFAKYTATDSENEQAIPVAVRFVNATFLQTLEEETNRG